MLIVIEGVDGAGKTSLATALQDLLPPPCDRVHFGPPRQDPLEEYLAALQAPLDAHRVIDRLHWGEMVYGPLYRGGSRLSDEGFRYIELVLQARGALTVLATAPLPVLRRRLAHRGEDFLRPEHLGRVRDGFLRTRHLAFSEILTLGTSGRSPEALALQVAGHARGNSAWHHPVPLDYIGNARPRVLLIGDTRGDPGHWCKLPFAPLPATSGRHLVRCVPHEWWGVVGIINSGDHVGHLRPLWQHVGEPATVALGAVAHRRLETEDVPHATCPHPQYARRFAHHRRDEYTNALRTAARGCDVTIGDLGWTFSH